MIHAENLVYEYPGKRALDDVSFDIAEGSITALVGPNGAGKTTLLRCLAALDDPFSGKIHIGGIDVLESPREVHRLLGYLSDFFGLYDALTVRQCLIFTARLHQLSEDKITSQIAWAAKLLELEPWLEKPAGTLSRGWRQRLGIAQAILHRPCLLLLDEPASGLDPEARVGLSGLFKHLRDEGMTLVVSSHILAELEDYCTEMLVIRDGKIVEHRKTSGTEAQHRVVTIGVVSEHIALSEKLKSETLIANITTVERTIRFDYSGSEDERHALLKRLIESGAKISAFNVEKASLQDVYMSLAHTKKGS